MGINSDGQLLVLVVSIDSYQPVKCNGGTTRLDPSLNFTSYTREHGLTGDLQFVSRNLVEDTHGIGFHHAAGIRRSMRERNFDPGCIEGFDDLLRHAVA
jgi:hypothetical protein